MNVSDYDCSGLSSGHLDQSAVSEQLAQNDVPKNDPEHIQGSETILVTSEKAVVQFVCWKSSINEATVGNHKNGRTYSTRLLLSVYAASSTAIGGIYPA